MAAQTLGPNDATIEHAQAVTTLRSGKVVDNKVQKVPQEPKDSANEQCNKEHKDDDNSGLESGVVRTMTP